MHTVKEFQVLLLSTNNSIQYNSFDYEHVQDTCRETVYSTVPAN